MGLLDRRSPTPGPLTFSLELRVIWNAQRAVYRAPSPGKASKIPPIVTGVVQEPREKSEVYPGKSYAGNLFKSCAKPSSIDFPQTLRTCGYVYAYVMCKSVAVKPNGMRHLIVFEPLVLKILNRAMLATYSLLHGRGERE